MHIYLNERYIYIHKSMCSYLLNVFVLLNVVYFIFIFLNRALKKIERICKTMHDMYIDLHYACVYWPT